MLGAMLLTAVNLAYYQDLMAGMRAAIANRQFQAFRDQLLAQWRSGDEPHGNATATSEA
jgi:queuine tRNA-ribosyltransferase